MTETQQPTVHEAVIAVMNEVQSVGKGDVNRDQGFRFRGIDAVVNAVGPALRKHGVLVVPQAESIDSERYETRSKAVMKNVTVKFTYSVIGPRGDTFPAAIYGEAADAGDKAVSKAQSVAYRSVLLQLLAIPTGDQDPDATVHERAGHGDQGRQQPPQQAPPIAQARAAVWQASQKAEPNLTDDQRNQWIKGELASRNLDPAKPGDLRKLAAALTTIDPWAERPTKTEGEPDA